MKDKVNNDIFRGVGVEITLKQPTDFLKIKETLTRIGIASNKENKLFQSCHILHKQGRYAIVHFKELFILDGKTTNIDDEDINRRSMIASLLEDWGLLDIVDSENLVTDQTSLNTIKIVPFKEKKDWELISKYSIGVKK